MSFLELARQAARHTPEPAHDDPRAESVRRFGHPAAALYPLLNERVRTPDGVGRLLQVFEDRVTVALDKEPATTRFYHPSLITVAELV